MSQERDEKLREILTRTSTIAVLGAHAERQRAAFYVPDYLYEQGYRVLPINPNLVGTTLWGQPVRATLAELGERVDMIDVFRRADHLPAHLDDMIAARPDVVWMQLGVRHEGVAAQLRAAGIDVVQDRCTLADHRRLL